MGGEGNLRHVVHKRVHLERPQPSKRRKLGTLEKHKDYVKRAQDYNKKQDIIKKLHRKAYFKNEDEFAFSMVNSKMVKGQWKTKPQHLSVDEIALADSQDAKYVSTRELIDKKAAAKRAEALHFLEVGGPKQHVLFVDDDDLEEDNASGNSTRCSATKRLKKLKSFNVATHLDTHPELLKVRANRPRLKQLETKVFADRTSLEAETKQAYKELFARQERAKRLSAVREELELRSHLRGKGKRFKVADAKDGRPAQYKWNFERKR